MHDYLARPEVWRQHHEDLLKEAENARLARDIRRGQGASQEWRINLGDGFCSFEGSRNDRGI